MEQELGSSREINSVWQNDNEMGNRSGNKTNDGQAVDWENAPKNQPKYVQTRRVGSVTFGITLVCYGILFLVHIFMPMLRYSVIFRCWPVIFILLGGEILVENYKCKRKDWKMVYDFPAVLMLCAMLLFAMVMAAIDFTLYYETNYGTIFF